MNTWVEWVRFLPHYSNTILNIHFWNYNLVNLILESHLWTSIRRNILGDNGIWLCIFSPLFISSTNIHLFTCYVLVSVLAAICSRLFENISLIQFKMMSKKKSSYVIMLLLTFGYQTITCWATFNVKSEK